MKKPEKDNLDTSVTEEYEAEVKRAKIKQSFLHFGTLYRIKSIQYQVLIAILVGLVFGIVQFATIQLTGLYEMGIAALSQSVARLTLSLSGNKVAYNVLFWMLNLASNIPLFILSYRKISKRFTLLTFIFMFVSSISGLIFSMWVPGSQNWYILGDLKGKYIVTWQNLDKDNLSVFAYALIWGAAQAIFTATLLIIEGCSGGFDILSVHMSRKKFKDVGFILGMLHFISLLIANLIGTFIPNYLDNGSDQLTFANYLSPTFIAGLIMVLFNGVLLNALFPKFKMVKVEIMTNEAYQIIDKLNRLKHYRFSTSVLKVEGGYSGKEQKIVLTVCLYIDAAKLIEVAKKIDDQSFVTVTDLKKADGYLYVVNTRRDKLFKSRKSKKTNSKNNTLF